MLTDSITEMDMTKHDVYRWESVAAYVVTFPTGDGLGACDVTVSIGQAGEGVWYVRTSDDAGGSDDGPDSPFASEAAARAAAEALADERDEYSDGDAQDWETAQLEATAEEDVDGEWCVYWETVGDDPHVVSRHPSREAAEAAAKLADRALRQTHRGHLLCGYSVRELIDGQWIAVEVES